jgi:DNA-binding NarL/FixJ family response regulator
MMPYWLLGARMGFPLAKRRTPDLVIMDISLPDIDGREVAGRSWLSRHLTQSLDWFYANKDREISAAQRKRLFFKIGVLSSTKDPTISLEGLKGSLLGRQ